MVNVLLKAKHEIVQLRKRNEILEAQMMVVDIFAAALGFKREQRGAEIDVVWELEGKIAELNTPKRMP
jgi:hypothetical protein